MYFITTQTPEAVVDRNIDTFQIFASADTFFCLVDVFNAGLLLWLHSSL